MVTSTTIGAFYMNRMHRTLFELKLELHERRSNNGVTIISSSMKLAGLTDNSMLHVKFITSIAMH